MLVLLENKIWRAQLPEGKQFVSEMEFRANIWRFTFLYKGQVDTPECYLWYVEDLPDKYKDKPVSMWTERPVYWENV